MIKIPAEKISRNMDYLYDYSKISSLYDETETDVSDEFSQHLKIKRLVSIGL